MARLGIRAVRTVARFAEQQQRARERELKQASKDDEAARRRKRPAQGARPAHPRQNGAPGSEDVDADEANAPVCQPEFAMPVNADGEIPDDFLPKF